MRHLAWSEQTGGTPDARGEEMTQLPSSRKNKMASAKQDSDWPVDDQSRRTDAPSQSQGPISAALPQEPTEESETQIPDSDWPMEEEAGTKADAEWPSASDDDPWGVDAKDSADVWGEPSGSQAVDSGPRPSEESRDVPRDHGVPGTLGVTGDQGDPDLQCDAGGPGVSREPGFPGQRGEKAEPSPSTEVPTTSGRQGREEREADTAGRGPGADEPSRAVDSRCLEHDRRGTVVFTLVSRGRLFDVSVKI